MAQRRLRGDFGTGIDEEFGQDEDFGAQDDFSTAQPPPAPAPVGGDQSTTQPVVPKPEIAALPEVPGVPRDFTQDFLRRNPGDEHRLSDAFRSDAFGDQGGGQGRVLGGPGPFGGLQGPQSDALSQFLQQLMTRNQAADTRQQGFEDQLRATLLDLMRRGQEPLDPDAAANAPEAKAFQRVRERALQRFRAKQAEQRAAQGLGQNQFGEVSGALGSDIQSGEADVSEQIAGFQSRLIAEQINRRRGELMQALQTGAGLLSGDQQNSIRRELAQLDALLRRETLGVQNQQFQDRLGFDIGTQQQLFNQAPFNVF